MALKPSEKRIKLKKYSKNILFFIVIYLFSINVYALRCGTTLIDVGDSKERVRNECGNPEKSKEWTIQSCFFNKQINTNNPSCIIGNTLMTEWIYSVNIGSGYNILTFENNKLKSIEFKR